MPLISLVSFTVKDSQKLNRKEDVKVPLVSPKLNEGQLSLYPPKSMSLSSIFPSLRLGAVSFILKDCRVTGWPIIHHFQCIILIAIKI